MIQREHSTSAWELADARELVFQALYTSFGSDLANLIFGIEASGNPRPLAGLSPDQLRGVSGQLEEMGVEIRQSLNAEAQVGFGGSLDAALGIVSEEMRAKTMPASSAWTQPEGA